MWSGLKQEFKQRVQNLAGIHEAIRSSVLAHQNAFGRPVILGTLAIRPECMHGPAKSFVSRVHRYTERRATPAA
jgi:hypothetical protein